MIKRNDVKPQSFWWLVATCKCEYHRPKGCMLKLFGKFGPEEKRKNIWTPFFQGEWYIYSISILFIMLFSSSLNVVHCSIFCQKFWFLIIWLYLFVVLNSSASPACLDWWLEGNYPSMEVMALLNLGVLSQVGPILFLWCANKYKSLCVPFYFCFENQCTKSNLDGN